MFYKLNTHLSDAARVPHWIRGRSLVQCAFLLCLLAFPLAAPALQDGWDCGPMPGAGNKADIRTTSLRNKVDDYRDTSKEAKFHLFLVEKEHYFKHIIKMDKAGIDDNATKEILDNMDYTLNHFPNHLGALYAVSQIELKLDGNLPQKIFGKRGDWHRSVACYVERALRFAPDDPGVYLVYGVHFHRKKDYSKALEMYKKAEGLGLDSMELHYNMGLLYFDLKKYDEAKKYAKLAYNAGYRLPGLKRKLQRVKKWK